MEIADSSADDILSNALTFSFEAILARIHLFVMRYLHSSGTIPKTPKNAYMDVERNPVKGNRVVFLKTANQ